MAEQGMPTTYETQQTTTTTTQGGIGIHPEYVKTVPGILKIIEIVVSLLTLICCLLHWFTGGSWVATVAISAFITTLIYFVMYLIQIRQHYHLRAFEIIEFVYYCVFTLFYLIAAIVAAAKASWHSSIGATAFFAFAATAVYAVDTYFQFRNWRSATPRTTMTTTSSGTPGHVASPTGMEQGKVVY